MSLFWFADVILPISILVIGYGGVRFYEWADDRERARDATKTQETGDP